MNKETIEELKDIFLQMDNPARLKLVCKAKAEVAVAASATNHNDTVGWYRCNSDELEKKLKEKGYKWLYHFETYDDGADPHIYLWVGKDITPETIREGLEKEGYKITKNHYFVKGNFADLEDTYIPKSEIEEVLMADADILMNVITP